MKLQRFDRNTTHALLNPLVADCVASVTSALEATPVPFWRGKSEKQAKKSILQPVLNAYIEQELLARGWEREVRVTGDEDGAGGMRVDFCKLVGGQLVVVEVQFGNVGRFYSDLHKFMHLQAENRLALAIHVSLTDEAANLTDSGIATFETAARRISEVADTILRAIPAPIVCLGLSHHGAQLVDFAQSQFPNAKLLQGEGAKTCINHAVSQLRSGVPIEKAGPPAVVRPQPKAVVSAAQTELAF